MRLFGNKKGLSLIEVLIAISIFAVVAVISSNILVDVVKMEKKSSIQNALYEDLRMILQQLTNEIQNGTIDYEEYYNYYVIQQAESALSDNVYYGVNYGVYGSRFYDPGKSLDGAATFNPEDLGIECSYPNPLAPGDECEVIYTLSLDLNTGQNPFTGDENISNAFCDNGTGKQHGLPCDTISGETDHLFLIDNTGTKKTIIAKKKTTFDDFAIGMVRLEGKDIDQNGIVDTFRCFEEYSCHDEVLDLANEIKIPFSAIFNGDKNTQDVITEEGITLPGEIDLQTAFINIDGSFNDNADFVPISPLRSNVIDLRFIIHPLEDPYKAYAEPDMQAHPSVTIILTIGLSSDAEEDYPGEFEPITVQTTVAAGVIGKIDSYPPVNDIKGSDDVGWIDNLLTGFSTPY